MGSDGKVGSMVGEDVYGVVLGYYDNDYSPVKATTQPFELAYAGSLFAGASNGLYNGNIRNATVALRSHLYYDDTDVSMSPIGYAYTYDQLNRYVKMRVYNNYDTATNEWQSGGAALQDYAENVLYDGNGNILAYIRHGNPTIGVTTGPTAMDSMAYVYNTSNNQLNRVADGVSSSNYSIDIDNEVSNNYLYDKNGEMTFDSSQHLTIAWNVRNKVATIYNDISKLLITFGYDAMGNRVMKRDSNLSTHKCYTLWYERDAQGNVLSMYKERHDSMWWQESDIYGSGRIGVYYPDSLIYPKGTQVSANDTFTMELWEGKRQYELVNHLGNVLTTVSDKKIMLSSNATNNSGTRNEYANIVSYQPEVTSITDFFPFGLEEPGRNFHLTDDTLFRYGFNNKEDDNDIEGTGLWQDYGSRIYLPGVCKFGSRDLFGNDFPWNSPYAFAEDRVINGVDLDGLEYCPPIPKYDYNGSWTDYISAVDNGVIDVVNIAPALWNSGVASVQSLGRGTYVKDLGTGLKNDATGIKNWAVSGYTYTVNTPFTQQLKDAGKSLVSPQTLENVTTLTVGSLIAVPTVNSVVAFSAVAGEGITGLWVEENTVGWSQSAIEYQEYVTGIKAGRALRVNGVDFDGIRGNTLLEAKSSYNNFVDGNGKFYGWFRGQNALLNQVRRQLVAAKGAPIEYNFSSQKTLNAFKNLFENNGIKKGVIYKYNPIQK